MDRRHALTALTAVAASSALLALPRPSWAQNAQPAQAAQPPTGVGPLTDSEYKTRTLAVGTLSKMASQIALTKATHPVVRQFARFEFDEQTAVAQALTDLADPPPALLDDVAQQKLAALKKASARDFDRAYIHAQIEGHQQLLAIQEGLLAGTGADRDHQHIAILAKATITMHLAMLGELRTAAT